MRELSANQLLRFHLRGRKHGWSAFGRYALHRARRQYSYEDFDRQLLVQMTAEDLLFLVSDSLKSIWKSSTHHNKMPQQLEPYIRLRASGST